MKKILKTFSLFLALLTLASCTAENNGTITTDTSGITTESLDENLPERLGVVWFTTPAIPADVGKEINLLSYDVQLSLGVTTTREKIVWLSEEIQIDENCCVTPANPGVYTLKAQYGEKSKNIYLIVRASESDEYVLYSNDFENAKAEDFNVIQKTNGTFDVKDGKMVLSAPRASSDYVRVLLPDFIGEFGDYKIKANATITQKADEKRWMSLMYRVQNNDAPYYQLCVRANASLSDGIELAHRNERAEWSYNGKGSFNEALSPDKMYEFTADVHGYYGAAYVNGEKIIETTDGLSDFPTGRVGFQVCGATAQIEDVKITVDFYEAEKFILEKGFADVRQLDTKIALYSSVITEITSIEEFEKILENSPSNAILSTSEMNGEVSVINKNGEKIASIDEAMSYLDGKIIPVFRPADKNSAKITAEYLKENKYNDVMVIGNSDVIGEFKKYHKLAKSILDLTNEDVSKLSTSDIRDMTNRSTSRVCLLPVALATSENTNYLNSLAITVWYKADKNDKVELYKLITSGANGILTTDRHLLEDCLTSSVFSRNSLVRPVLIIGHRGIPQSAPENTIYGSLLASEYGASIIENDIYITKDDVIVVMHDGTIDRTTNGAGSIESMTYAQLSQYSVDYFGGVAPQPIPTLEDYFKTFKGTGVNLFIEIKSTQTRIVKELKKLIEQYDIMDQCCVISFHAQQINQVRKSIPELSCGFLNDDASSLSNVLNKVSNYDSTFNPSYGRVNAELMQSASYRGVSIWPWTVDDERSFANFYLAGTWGITTNRADFVKDYIKFLTPEESYSITVGEEMKADIKALTYSGDVITPDVEMTVIDGNGTVKYEDGTFTANEAGDAVVIFKAKYKINGSGKLVCVYSQPVTVSAG